MTPLSACVIVNAPMALMSPMSLLNRTRCVPASIVSPLDSPNWLSTVADEVNVTVPPVPFAFVLMSTLDDNRTGPLNRTASSVVVICSVPLPALNTMPPAMTWSPIPMSMTPSVAIVVTGPVVPGPPASAPPNSTMPAETTVRLPNS